MAVIEAQLEAARQGDAVLLGRLLEPYRHYLRLLARVRIGPQIQGKADESDIVQETFLSAQRCFPEFRGATEAELLEWLRSILAARLADLMRRYLGTRCRDARLEREISDSFDRSTTILGGGLKQRLVSPESSPSHRAARHEEAVRLADALALLPDDYREVIVLRNLEGLPFADVAARMQRTVPSVEKLWLRSLARLKQQLGAGQ